MGVAFKQAELFEVNEIAVTVLDNMANLPLATRPDAPLEEKIELAIEGMMQLMREGRHALVLSSMGKDSSVLCTLALWAIHRAIAQGINVPHVLFGFADTEYDNPIVNRYAKRELKKLSEYIQRHNLPAEVIVATPTLSNDNLVNIMGGRGTASMPGMDRSCSIQLKVSVGNRMKKIAKKRIKGEVVNVVGKRWEESSYRKANMVAAGERPDMTTMINGQPLLSPIAHFTTDDLWGFIAMVRNSEKLPPEQAYANYSDFAAMLDVYRDANGGECELVAFTNTKKNATGCSARTGCLHCSQVADDRSMENMLVEYPQLRSLFNIRNWIGAMHFDPKRRRWLSREPNADGELSIEPNAYSPNTCRELMRYYLSAQADEEIRAHKAGEEPLFDVIPERKLIAIQLLWLRHGYHEPWAALRDWKAVYEEGERWYPPVDMPIASRKDFPRPKKVRFPLTVFTGADPAHLHSAAQMATGVCTGSTADSSASVPLNDDGEFSVDQDGAECFIGFIAGEAIAKADKHPPLPSDQLRTLLNMGTVKLRNGQAGYWEKVMTISDTLVKHDVPAIIDNPVKLLQVTEGAA